MKLIFNDNSAKLLSLLLIIGLVACTKNTKENLEYAIKQAGTNRAELEKVIDYYSLNPSDSLKYKAACFLIENMPAHYSIDTSYINKMIPIYEKYAEISKSDNWRRSDEWKRKVDSLENKNGYLFFLSSTNIKKDIEIIKSDWLIEHINLSFKAWESNIYTKDLSFDLFCEHVLPYRFKDGVIIDHSRTYFHNKHKSFFNGEYGSCINAIDSALYQMKEIKNNIFHGNKLSQVFNYKTIEQIRYIQCYDKCWYNAASLAAAGIPVAIDCVPSWGNRGNGHTWNALVFNNDIYPFEPFWDEDRWKYKEIYNKKAIDSVWGKLRLPKVFRISFSLNNHGPYWEKGISRENIPPFFQNPLIKDVSHQYFDTTNIHIGLPDSIKTHPKYAYIFVSSSTGWVPVQWGKVKKREIVFTGMGRDIVYIAGFYAQNNITPISSPFYLDTLGNINYIKGSRKKHDMIINNIGTFTNIASRNKMIAPINKAMFVVEHPNKNFFDTLHIIPRNADVSDNFKILDTPVKTRHIVLKLPTDTIAFSEITFYTNERGTYLPIQNILLKTLTVPINNAESPEMMFDHLSGTGFKGKLKQVNAKELVFDVDSSYTIAALNYIPYYNGNIKEEHTYRLLYWENEWKLFGKAEAKSNNSLTFKNVPEGFLYRIDSDLPSNYKRIERIFTYENGIIYWR